LILLIAHKGTFTTKLITKSLNKSPPTARRIMTELKDLEMIDEKSGFSMII